MSDEPQDDVEKRGLPSIVSRSPEEGLESALDALRPSLLPVTETSPEAAPVVALVPEDSAEQRVLDVSAESTGSPSSRPGLLSVVLSRPPAAHDPGARTAHLSIPRRGTPQLGTALLDSGLSGERERAGLLEHLAALSEGATRARLLTAAAEHWRRLGETSHSASLYEYAEQSNPRDVVVLRELRRRALCDRDLDRAHELVERETTLPLSPEENALTLLLLAELQRAARPGTDAAEATAEQAFRTDPTATAGLVLLELRASAGRFAEAAETEIGRAHV